LDNQKKVLLVSGSPRDGNTNYILGKISEGLRYPTETVLLKDKDIKHCIGCLSCHSKPDCGTKDDMYDLLNTMKEADIIVIGTPNYFDNVSGLLKDFIDRTHPLYKPEALKGKKLVLIMVGGGEPKGTQEFLDTSLYGFVKYHKLDMIGSHSFKGLDRNDFKKDKDLEQKINMVIEEISRV